MAHSSEGARAQGPRWLVCDKRELCGKTDGSEQKEGAQDTGYKGRMGLGLRGERGKGNTWGKQRHLGVIGSLS